MRMKSLAANLLFVILVLATLLSYGCQETSRQEKIRTASRFLKVFRSSRPYRYDPTREVWIRREYSLLHAKVEDVPEQHAALIEDVLREHTLPMD